MFKNLCNSVSPQRVTLLSSLGRWNENSFLPINFVKEFDPRSKKIESTTFGSSSQKNK